MVNEFGNKFKGKFWQKSDTSKVSIKTRNNP